MKRVLLTTVFVLTAASAFAAGGNIRNTKHDLGANSTVTLYKDATSTQTCKFCHVPHNASATGPLWSRASKPGTVTALYANAASLNATMPTAAAFTSAGGTSILCMSCHDGVQTVSSKGAITTTANLTQNLSNTHPIGFDYNTALETLDGGGLVANATAVTGGTPLFSGKMECASCHAVHDASKGSFLRINNAGSNLCLNCHIK